MGNTIVCKQCEQPTEQNKNYANLNKKTHFGSKREKISTTLTNRQKYWEGPAIKHITINQDINEILYPDGSYYKGQTLNSMRHGKGIQHLDGIQYDGMWWNDKAHGKGHLRAKNFQFQGFFQANHIVKGKMKIFKGKITEIYQGQFKEFKYHGKGVLKIAGQSRYEGEFKNHKKQGKGKIVYENGSSYQGEFKNGMMCGFGTYRSMQFQYTGEFVDNKINGKGVCRKNIETVENEMLNMNRMCETSLSQTILALNKEQTFKNINNFTFAKPKLRA